MPRAATNGGKSRLRLSSIRRVWQHRRGWLLAWAAGLLGCGLSSERPQPVIVAATVIRPADEQHVQAFCGGCHAAPDPQGFAVKDWREEVAQGYRFHRDSGRTDLRPPPQEAVVAYYESLAPAALQLDGAAQVVACHTPSPLTFDQAEIHVDSTSMAPAAARIEALAGGLVVTDMRGGAVWHVPRQQSGARRAWTVPHPASAALFSITPGAQPGVVLADLGSFLPEDHQRGGLWWAESPAATNVKPLVSSLGRVSHVAVGDLDGDGRDDLVVSEFGWRRTGRLMVYWNDPAQPWPHLSPTVVDPRHGALKAAIRDFDGDGHAEIIAAFAQEFESIEIYRPIGPRQFERSTLYRAPDPSWGSSDFEVVDLDHDGRQDLILCHGDSFDGGDLRPYHGVRWLRQTADRQIEVHLLAEMPGVHRAVAADLDEDGDLDLAAVSLLPKTILDSPTRPKLASVAWLEQVTAGRFVPHVLEWDQCTHAACATWDEDGDGDLDLLVGHFHWDGHDTRLVTVFRNGGRR